MKYEDLLIGLIWALKGFLSPTQLVLLTAASDLLSLCWPLFLTRSCLWHPSLLPATAAALFYLCLPLRHCLFIASSYPFYIFLLWSVCAHLRLFAFGTSYSYLLRSRLPALISFLVFQSTPLHPSLHLSPAHSFLERKLVSYEMWVFNLCACCVTAGCLSIINTETRAHMRKMHFLKQNISFPWQHFPIYQKFLPTQMRSHLKVRAARYLLWHRRTLSSPTIHSTSRSQVQLSIPPLSDTFEADASRAHIWAPPSTILHFPVRAPPLAQVHASWLSARAGVSHDTGRTDCFCDDLLFLLLVLSWGRDCWVLLCFVPILCHNLIGPLQCHKEEVNENKSPV